MLGHGLVMKDKVSYVQDGLGRVGMGGDGMGWEGRGWDGLG